MNLVLLGHFNTLNDAKKAKDLIDEMTRRVDIEVDEDRLVIGGNNRKFSEQMLDYLRETNMFIIQPQELEQLRYEASVKHEGNQLKIRTDEIDVSIFMKLMIDSGAKVEVYSAHDYPDTNPDRKTKDN